MVMMEVSPLRSIHTNGVGIIILQSFINFTVETEFSGKKMIIFVEARLHCNVIKSSKADVAIVKAAVVTLVVTPSLSLEKTPNIYIYFFAMHKQITKNCISIQIRRLRLPKSTISTS
jgi:hypothetical protein